MKLPSTEPKTNVKTKDFWACERCKITSNTKGRMIPCPRGGCDAEVVGTTEIITCKQFTPNKK